ncbi:uncharacterized protein LOC117791234 [Drosophila innubila]|uniref:uncharacterized protein LOC117791234 n=1 Tax=Drosophila innubila TaxID=198719 RepID=UPI00148BB0B3|nr:uncharacterized protein LOC117791234 [Drosophila innubila]
MNKLSVNSLENCELGNIAAERIYAPSTIHRQQCVSTPILIRGILMLILFNICLVAGVYFFYVYVNTLPTDERNKLNTAFCSVAAILVFISLLNLGDLSKTNSNFYYI